MFKKDERIVFIFGAALGAVLFILIFGFDVLDFTYVDWLLPRDIDDLTQHYLGWIEYRASDWHFPLGMMENVQYPNLVSVIYTDSIPLFAFFFKLLSNILPENFQYFGLFGILCYMLQGGFSACFIYHFTEKKVFSILSSLFFSGSLLMLFRMYYHTSLSAHWLILASLYIWICKESELSTVKSVIAWSALSAIATLTHIYFLPMIWGCMLCDILGQVLAYKYQRGFLSLLFSGISVLLPAWLIGVFTGDDSKGGLFYGVYSFNLNGFFNTQDYTLFFPGLPVSSSWQYEGLAYLGAGVFLLIILCLIMMIANLIQRQFKKTDIDAEKASSPEEAEANTSKSKINKRKIKKAIPFIIFFLAFTLFAASNVITFGTHALYIPITNELASLLSVFRCSGRLIWPVYYMITLFTCIYVHRLIRKNYIPEILIGIAFIVQMIDLSPQLSFSHEKYAPSERIVYESLLTDPAWEECADKYSHIMFYPDVLKLVSGRKLAGYELQYYACKNHMSLNMIIISRVSTEKVNENVYAHFEQLKEGNVDPDTMYIFLDELPMESCGLHYYYIDEIFVGTPEPLEHAQEINITFQTK